MTLNRDLQKFRDEWQKELSHSINPESVNVVKHQSQNSDDDTNLRVRDQVEGSSSDSQPKTEHKNVTRVRYSLELHKDHDCGGMDQEHDKIVGIGGDYSQQGQSQSSVHDDLDQYYPFKILTQFLNEAPRKVIPSRKRNAYQNPTATYCKKKYFDNLSRSNDNNDNRCSSPIQSKSHEHAGTDRLTKRDGDRSERMLDIFIADLDEINEIPFFDSSLPREVAFKIFQYLDMPTLCICSQVSRSWKSLADDDLLWCRVCHKMGFDANSRVFEDTGWKGKVRQHIQQQKALEANWKARVGKPYQLKFARGGVLCGVASHQSTIVAGYTSCQVKSWNTLSGDECTFKASNTALVIDENAEELGCIHNEIRHISTTSTITAASFKHGFVDIWKNSGNVDPIHTISFNNPDMTCLCAHDLDKCCSLVAASQQTRIQVTRIDSDEGTKLVDIDMKSPVCKMLWLDGCKDKASLVVSCQSSVWMKDFHANSPAIDGVIAQDNLSMTEVHNLFYAPITCLGSREGYHEVGVGFNMITGASSQPKVNVYDLNVLQPKASLTGHTWLISCMDLPSASPQQLVTGSGDRKVRLFDLRTGTTPLMSLIGHSNKINCVQMDEVKIVSGDEAGFVCVWDVRTGRKLWEIHNRHPVQYCHFDGRLLIIGNIPYDKFPENEKDEFESVSSLRLLHGCTLCDGVDRLEFKAGCRVAKIISMMPHRGFKSFPLIPHLQCRDLACLSQISAKGQRLKSNLKQVRKTLNQEVEASRYRGTVQFYDFLANQQTQGVPEICLSSYNEPEAFDYNLALAVPYDSL